MTRAQAVAALLDRWAEEVGEDAAQGLLFGVLLARAALRLLYDLGLRRSEVVGLDMDDLDLDTGTVAVLGKGRTQKISLTLPDPTKRPSGNGLRRGAQSLGHCLPTSTGCERDAD
jgi:integrase